MGCCIFGALLISRGLAAWGAARPWLLVMLALTETGLVAAALNHVFAFTGHTDLCLASQAP